MNIGFWILFFGIVGMSYGTHHSRYRRRRSISCSELDHLRPDTNINQEMFNEQLKERWYLSMSQALKAKPYDLSRHERDEKEWTNMECAELVVVDQRRTRKKMRLRLEYLFDEDMSKFYARVNKPEEEKGIGVYKYADISVWGNGKIAKVGEHHSYVLHVGCIYNRYPHWVVLSKHKHLTRRERNEILRKVSDMGFDSSMVAFPRRYEAKYMKAIDCDDSGEYEYESGSESEPEEEEYETSEPNE